MVKFTLNGDGDMATTSTTAATSATTGSIKTAGGVGVAQQLYTGGILAAMATIDSTSTTTGAVVVAGGMGVAKDVYIGGVLIVSEGTSVQVRRLAPDSYIQLPSNFLHLV